MDLLQKTLGEAQELLARDEPAPPDRMLTSMEEAAFVVRNAGPLKKIWPVLSRARRRRREKAAAGRIDLHTHTTASDGNFTVEQSLCEHFRQGQILIDDHNIIDSLGEARRLVRERDLELDVFLGIEAICTNERRAFEFHAVAPTLSPDFVKLSLEHREMWGRACDRFIEDLVARDDFFDDPLWKQIAQDHEVRESFDPVIERYAQVRGKISKDEGLKRNYLENNKTFDMGNLWNNWGLGREGDPPQLAHRFFGSMRCYAMNAYRDELGDWFDYEKLARKFKQVGCVISHNHPNYWDEDFIGELPHTLQEQWIREWAKKGIIDALEVWSPPFASKRVPHYWEKVARDCALIPMAGTDCHSGREQEIGGRVENHPETPAMLYEKLCAPAVEKARAANGAWDAFEAWRGVLEIDYACDEALRNIESIVADL